MAVLVAHGAGYPWVVAQLRVRDATVDGGLINISAGGIAAIVLGAVVLFQSIVMFYLLRRGGTSRRR